MGMMTHCALLVPANVLEYSRAVLFKTERVVGILRFVTQHDERIFWESSDSSGPLDGPPPRQAPQVADGCGLVPAMSASQAIDQASRHLLGVATSTKKFEWIAVIGGFLAFFAAFGIGKSEHHIVQSLEKVRTFVDAPNRSRG